MFGKMKAAMAATAAAGLLALAGASAADAATITGGGSFTGNAASSRLVVTSGGGIPLNCTGSSGSGTINNGTYTTFPSVVGSVTPTFTGCTGPAGLQFTVACSARNLSILGNPVAGTTPGSLLVSCIITFPTIPCSGEVSGTVRVSYTNPSGSPARGRLTVLAAGQNLRVTTSNCPAAILPVNAQADFGGTGAGSLGLTDLTYTLTTTGPTIT